MRDIGFENVLYHDTDSAIFIEKKGENDWVLKERLGKFLGYLTLEVKDDKGKFGTHKKRIVEYVGTAPKSYSLKTVGQKLKKVFINREIVAGEDGNGEFIIEKAVDTSTY